MDSDNEQALLEDAIAVLDCLLEEASGASRGSPKAMHYPGASISVPTVGLSGARVSGPGGSAAAGQSPASPLLRGLQQELEAGGGGAGGSGSPSSPNSPGGRRSSVMMYGVTAAQDERLARALERARGMDAVGAARKASGALSSGSNHALNSEGGVAGLAGAGPRPSHDLVGTLGPGQASLGRNGGQTEGPSLDIKALAGDKPGGSALGNQGLMLWAGNKSRVERARLAVRLLAATGLRRTRADAPIDPFAAVSCEDIKHRSKAVMKSKEPFWDEFFVFDVRQPAFAVLKIKVYDHLRCWRPAFMGQVRIPVNSIAETPDHFSRPMWHPLTSWNGRPRGEVQMQLFYTAEWVRRPLRVLAGTWNVGNAEPPPDLSSWLQGVDALQHDLVAIGVQECLYKVGGGGGEDAAALAAEAEALASGAGALGFGEEPAIDDVLSAALARHYSREGTSSLHGHGDRSTGVKSPVPGRRGGKAYGKQDSTSTLLEALAQAHAHTRGSPSTGARSPLPRTGTGPGSAFARPPPDDSGGTTTEPGSPPEPASGVTTRENSTLVVVTTPGGPSHRGSGLAQGPEVSASSASNPAMARTRGGRMRARGPVAAPPGQSQGGPGQGQGPSHLHPGAKLAEGAPGGPGPGGLHPAASDRKPSGSGQDLSLHGGISGAPSLGGALLPSVASGANIFPPPPPFLRPREPSHTQGHGPGPGPGPGPGVGLGPGAYRRPSGMEVAGPAGGRGAPGLPPPMPWAPTVPSQRHSGGAPGIQAAGSLPGEASFTAAGFSRTGTGAPAAGGGGVGGQTIKRDMAKAGRGEFKEMWEDRMKDAVGPGYFKVASVHMGQIRLLVFARNDIYAAVSDVRTAKQPTGVAGVATNKGGVAVSLRVWDTSLAFVNSHLAAHQDRTRARNHNYRDITRGLKLDPAWGMDVLTAFHHVVWMGDLNYRLDYGAQAVTPTESPTPADFAALVGEVQRGYFHKLQEVDQLKREVTTRRAFLGFGEGDIQWEPSFKVKRQRGHEYNPQRSPAWCDRILYRSNLPLKQIRVLGYFSAPDIATSDHKPVGAVLQVPTVWRTTVEEEPQHHAYALPHLSGLFSRAPGYRGSQLGAGPGAGAMAAANAGGEGPQAAQGMSGLSHPHPHPHPHPHLHLPFGGRHGHGAAHGPQVRIRLVFTLLHATGLFMVRSRRRSSGEEGFPSPQLLMAAPCMRAACVRSRVAPLTRDPTWASADDEALGPLVLELKTAALAEMAHFRIFVKVMDVRGGAASGSAAAAGAGSAAGGGKKGPGDKAKAGGATAGRGGGGAAAGPGEAVEGSSSVLARGVLPLTDAVTKLLQDAAGTAPFRVHLELHGLPAGSLQGSMRLEVHDRSKSLDEKGSRHVPTGGAATAALGRPSSPKRRSGTYIPLASSSTTTAAAASGLDAGVAGRGGAGGSPLRNRATSGSGHGYGGRGVGAQRGVSGAGNEAGGSSSGGRRHGVAGVLSTMRRTFSHL
ncbi:hypothetical protein HYH03_003669 [Edaphochlamys debaryana]|uniref:C2 domain-containing protein n=1 Tax=Edaphochlamys debaryana TaxID=47281 RepID=A0A835YGS6_9CHLO|nr:hypothetical protein HYH03_003669 [Edaphochlamys debaryana]|eukprot:KAG2498410.1 hypothetical protein HYH03_003669 [Edaphochlamys debaryana]